MTGEAGTRIPEKSPGWGHCGTREPGWIRGVHPSTSGSKAVVTVCFHWIGDDCRYSVNTTVINCGDYFLYDLPKPNGCVSRYCGS